MQQKKRIDQENTFRKNRKLGLRTRNTNQLQGHEAPVTKQSIIPEKEQLADQITSEINERIDYMNEMEAMGELSKADKRKLQGEIRARTIELETMEI